MSNNKTKDKKKKQKNIYTVERADGMKEVVVSKPPQKTVMGKIVIITLAALLGGASIIGLIFVLVQL